MVNQIRLGGGEYLGTGERSTMSSRIVFAGGTVDPSRSSAETILKAVGGIQSRRGPKHIKHNASEAVRRYTSFSQNILDDGTPHLDAWMLRNLADRNVVLQAVIQTILNQVASHFARPLTDKSIGGKVIQRDRKKALTAAAAKRAKELEDIVYDGGIKTNHPITGEPGCWDGHYETQSDPLDITVRKLMRDSLILDRVFITIEGNYSGTKPVMFWKAEDAGLMRLVDTPLYEPQIRNGSQESDDLSGKVKYVMLSPDFDWRVEREYMWNEGAMSFRNPRTDFLTFGYGKSEAEMCLGALLGILYSMQANSDYFTKNHVPAGILTIFGNFSEPSIQQLQDQLTDEVGMPGASYWATPVLQAQPQQGNAVEWTPLQDRARMDMVFRAYIELCVALVAAVFQIAPEEFGFHSFGGPSSTLGEASPEDKFNHSQHKGLLPKIVWLADYISRNTVERIDPDFQFVIQGLDTVYNPEQLLKVQLDMGLMQNGMSINEIRARNDEPPVVDALDEELWDQIKDKHANKWYATERERMQAMEDEYRKAGGQCGNYPNAPVGNPGALQQYQADRQQGQQVQEQMNEQAGAEQDASRMGEQNQQAGVQQDMAGMTQRADELQSGEDMAGQEAAQASELRIPQAPDAAFGALKKAIRVYRVGPRDEE